MPHIIKTIRRPWKIPPFSGHLISFSKSALQIAIERAWSALLMNNIVNCLWLPNKCPKFMETYSPNFFSFSMSFSAAVYVENYQTKRDCFTILKNDFWFCVCLSVIRSLSQTFLKNSWKYFDESRLVVTEFRLDCSINIRLSTCHISLHTYASIIA